MPHGDGRVDGFATEVHYLAHLAPIWHGLPPEARGTFFVAGGLAASAASEGLPGMVYGYPPPSGRPVMVAGFKDEQVLERPVIYVEHGAGQRYQGDKSGKAFDDPCYSGSPGHHRCVLFICPNPTVVAAWNDRYPKVPAVAAGCPKLDHLIGRPRPDSKTVTFSFHSAIRLAPETASAFDYYDQALPGIVDELRSDGWEVLGHGHPRLWSRIRPRWAQVGVEAVQDFAEVLQRSSCFAVDNSSTLFEAAACGIPTVAMNAPFYRRDVEHGLRFWSHIPGLMVGEPSEVVAAINLGYVDPSQWRDHREKVVSQVYSHRGHATGVAVRALLDVLG